MDCNGEFCVCSICKDNELNGGTCSHCFTCVNGCKADNTFTTCFVPLKGKIND